MQVLLYSRSPAYRFTRILLPPFDHVRRNTNNIADDDDKLTNDLFLGSALLCAVLWWIQYIYSIGFVGNRAETSCGRHNRTEQHNCRKFTAKEKVVKPDRHPHPPPSTAVVVAQRPPWSSRAPPPSIPLSTWLPHRVSSSSGTSPFLCSTTPSTTYKNIFFVRNNIVCLVHCPRGNRAQNAKHQPTQPSSSSSKSTPHSCIDISGLKIGCPYLHNSRLFRTLLCIFISYEFRYSIYHISHEE